MLVGDKVRGEKIMKRYFWRNAISDISFPQGGIFYSKSMS
jgi:hypothetical protein